LRVVTNADAGGVEALQHIAATIDYPMWIVTAANATERSGCLVGFASQCSIEPVAFAVWVSKANHTYRIAATSTVLAVHALRRGDHPLAELFGARTGDDVDKFARCTWQPGPAGVPVLDGCDWFAGRVTARLDTGDHVCHVLDPLAGGIVTDDEPQLSFSDVRDVDAGHDPD
jgi:flavin reductase (DIM6/NTAB) family NADH-FMN oxidoreductase RutF